MAASRRRILSLTVVALVLGALLYRASAQHGDLLLNLAGDPRGKFHRLAAVLGHSKGYAGSEDVCPRSPYGATGQQRSPSYWAETDVRMADVYDEIPFNELVTRDSGWTQGFPIHYDLEHVVEKEPRLEIIVMPHSHNDPGWLKTFEEYYTTTTSKILSNAHNFLRQHKNMSFEWAEISYLELWWQNHPEWEREAMKRVIDNGQLEILTGAWVMTDEANSHYFSTVMQMFEGHEWIKNHLNGVVPVSHWSIDPFGLSPTLVYLAKQAGLRWGVVQRAHYAVKAYLAKRKQLEFNWRQLWAGTSPADDFFTQLMPFVSYDISKTCGPDPEVCCQFDFLYVGMMCERGGGQIEAISSENVGSKAGLLADQFRKKAQLFKTNVILVPWGTDFRYEREEEWPAQYNNLMQIFDHINARGREYNMNARFGTLKDYFRLVEERATSEQLQIPSLSGDFFTYSDRDDHYWSGYFTSRPFHKHMDRSLQHYLRAADILFSVANQRRLHGTGSTYSHLFELYPYLVEARRSLSLFQHHDGVSGTAKDFVMQDYATKMLTAINNCISIISHASAYLLNFQDSFPRHAQSTLPFSNISSTDDDFFITHDWEYSQVGLPSQKTLPVPSSLLLFNSLAFGMKEVVCVFVARKVGSWVQIESLPDRRGDAGEGVEAQWAPLESQQLQPVIEVRDGFLAAADDKLELCFLAGLPALGFSRYRLSVVDSEKAEPVDVKLSYKGQVKLGDWQAKRVPPSSGSISLSNGRLSLTINPRSGLLNGISSADWSSPPMELDLSFVQYGSRKAGFGSPNGADVTSGAYLFLPDGPARPLERAGGKSYVIIDGPVRQTMVVKFPEPNHLVHVVELDMNSDSVTIRNLIDLSNRQDIEVAMRIKSDSSMSDFYTELNGAHFFPMSGAAFIQSPSRRLSLLGRQALGVSSLEPGLIEVVLDRRLQADDHRGLDQGVLDNRLTESRFRLALERFPNIDVSGGNKKGMDEKAAATGYHSLLTYQASLKLHYPPLVEFTPLPHPAESPSQTSLLLKDPLPCDVHLVALRTLSAPTIYANIRLQGEGPLVNFTSLRTKPKPAAALILHRNGVECRLAPPISNHNDNSECDTALRGESISVEGLFKTRPKRVANATLTLMQVDEGEVKELALRPMEVKSWFLEF